MNTMTTPTPAGELSNEQLDAIWAGVSEPSHTAFARAVIAADRALRQGDAAMKPLYDLLTKWTVRTTHANPDDAAIIRTHIRELRTAIAALTAERDALRKVE